MHISANHHLTKAESETCFKKIFKISGQYGYDQLWGFDDNDLDKYSGSVAGYKKFLRFLLFNWSRMSPLGGSHLLISNPSDVKEKKVDISLILTKLFNRSLSQEAFSDNLNRSINVSTNKQGLLSSAENFRPINSTSPFSKVYESIVRSISNHLYSNSLLHSSQYGFLYSRSCSSCELEFITGSWTLETMVTELSLYILI